jgi:hypothetical protein
LDAPPGPGGDLLTGDARLWLPARDAGITRHDGDGTGNGNGNGNDASFDSCRAGWVAVETLLPAPGEPDVFVTFANVGAGAVALASDARKAGVRLRWDAATFPHLWLWRARRKSITCVAPEPSTTYLPELGPHPRPEILRLLRRGESCTARLELVAFAARA